MFYSLSILLVIASTISVHGFKHLPAKVVNRFTKTNMFSETMPTTGDDTIFLSENEKNRIKLFETVRPSVVYISKFAQAFNPMLMNVMEIPAQTGSGFVWDDKHIVTNFHVVGQGTTEVQVTFVDNEGNREAFRASVRGVDPDKDIAVLKLIESSDKPLRPLKPLTIGSSNNLRVGQSAIAIGNPFGLDHTLTTGVVSGLGRMLVTPGRRPIFNMIQSDAAINPGNSGGPLLDSMGRLIGMNTAIYSTSGSSAGVGFAIPVDTLKAVVETIVRDGKVVRPATGIQYLSGDQSRALGVTKGIVVLGVSPGSSAETAGLRGITRSMFAPISLGDIIIAINGKKINTEGDFLKGLDGKKVGDTIDLTILRNIGGSVPGAGGGVSTQVKEAVELTVRLKLQPFEEAYPMMRR